MSEYFDAILVERAAAGQHVTTVEHEQPQIIRALLARGLSHSQISDRLSVGKDKIMAAMRDENVRN